MSCGGLENVDIWSWCCGTLYLHSRLLFVVIFPPGGKKVRCQSSFGTKTVGEFGMPLPHCAAQDCHERWGGRAAPADHILGRSMRSGALG